MCRTAAYNYKKTYPTFSPFVLIIHFVVDQRGSLKNYNRKLTHNEFIDNILKVNKKKMIRYF